MMHTFKTNIIPVWNRDGEQISEILLPEPVIPALNRRGAFSKSGLYYKGAGVIYKKHLANEILEGERKVKNKGLVYLKYEVNSLQLDGKFGIFTFPHQPIFSDYEGGCGPKEHRILENFTVFKRSNIAEICNVIGTGLEGHNIYVLKTKEITSSPVALLDLMEYVLTENWNMAWDKNLWSDIEQYGFIRDIADWFKSAEFRHKIGTIHSILYSLYKADIYLYTATLNRLFGCNYYDKIYIPYLSALVVNRFSPETLPKNLDLENLNTQLFKQLLSTLYSGKACCHLEFEEQWAWTREAFKEKYIDFLIQIFEHEQSLVSKRENTIQHLNKKRRDKSRKKMGGQ